MRQQMFEKVSIQSCEGSSEKSEENYDRLGRKAIYAFIYPNFMINRCLLCCCLGMVDQFFSHLIHLNNKLIYSMYLFCKLACFITWGACWPSQVRTLDGHQSCGSTRTQQMSSNI